MTSRKQKFFIVMSIVIFVLMLALGVLGSVLGWWIDEAGDVVKEEFGPKAALEKYEWFVYQANAIAKADSDIALFEQRLVDIETQYTSTYGEDKTKWMPSTQAQYNHEMQIARDDLMAIVSNRNGLVKDYNTESQKFNWAPFKGRADYPPESFLDYKVH